MPHAPPQETQSGVQFAAAAEREPGGTRLLILAVIITALLTIVLHGIGVSRSPDIFGDEGLYHLVALNLATGVGLYDDGGIFFWHPPGYPLLQGAWIVLTGNAGLEPIAGILQGRQLNVVLSALTAGLLVAFGRQLLDLRTGLLMGGVFMGDLFVQRINRRAMVETAAELLIILALFLFYRYRHQLTTGRVMAVGVVVGLAILTKEVAATAILVLLAYSLLFQRPVLSRVVGIAAVAGSMYAAYVAWALAVAPERFAAFKLSAISRIFAFGRGLVPAEARVDVGANPGILERVGPGIVSYGPSYLLLALGAGAVVLLWLRYRREDGAGLLIAWGGVTYVLIALGSIAGFGDQFFYYVLVPAIAAIAYVMRVTWRTIDRPVVPIPGARSAVGIATVALLALALYDGTVWLTRHGLGRDDGYARITAYVREHVPPGSTIVVGADVSNFLLRPEYDIEFYRDSGSVRRDNVRYFIMSSKEAEQRYNRMSPDFYQFVRDNTEPMLEVEGETYWTLGVYRWVEQGAVHVRGA